ncbi:hypothetical protein GGE06_007537 [Streptomyces sp. SFB5A]|uniref:Transposase n=1 Tax=Streptomyces nymphaeiformis TaxID=2663842 RepID=A0A7W7XF56_9ACTN|nr:hypothetical protein [Streptomyces nymphaeiformis]
MVPYRAMLDVPHELVEHVSWLIYARRCERRSRWRKLDCFQQALLALVHLRKNETLPALAAGFGVSTATAWRYVDETLDVLAAWAPGLHEALTGLGGGDHVIVDGTLIATDRIKADEPYYSMKHRKHGMNVQVIARPDGTPLWFSRATPGRTHDLTAARAHRRRPGLPDPTDPHPCGPRLPGRRRHRPHPLLPPPRTDRPLPALQPRPRQTEGPGRTRLRSAEVLATAPPGQMLHPPHRHHRPSRPHAADLRLFRMKRLSNRRTYKLPSSEHVLHSTTTRPQTSSPRTAPTEAATLSPDDRPPQGRGHAHPLPPGHHQPDPIDFLVSNAPDR